MIAFARHLMLFFISILIVTNPKWSDAQSSSAAYDTTGLISNSAVWTLNFDTSLLDPQGMARAPAGPWRVADEGRGRITPYNGDGVSFPGLSPLIISIPENPGRRYDYPAPVGIVYNNTKDFELAPGLPAQFLIATRDGTIEGWNSDLYRDAAVLVVDNSSDAAYTGIAIAQAEDGNRLYAANFRQNRIDVFDANFSPLLLSAHAFTDTALPEGFAPFNIQNINNSLYVTFAAQAADSRHAASGEGSGYVDVFDAEGELVMKLEQGPWMNAPWGIAQAPDRFGEYSSHLLVGNAGSGRIAAFDEESGLFTGFLSTREGTPIIIPGLHGLGFGNDGLAGPSDTLYFTSGFRGSEPNIFGAIKPEVALQTGPAPDSQSGPAASTLY
jgi:uncharacterized protein (TIGR03118 family)